jgi:hypothetical protein
MRRSSTRYLLINFHINPSGSEGYYQFYQELWLKKNSQEILPHVSVSIYPVPVRDNSFTIKSDKDISFVKITNIIGQDISRLQFNDPQQLIKLFSKIPKEECTWLLLFSATESGL